MLIVGDLHFDNPENYIIEESGEVKNLVLDSACSSLDFILSKALDDESVIFLGDIFEKKDRIPNVIKNALVKILLKFKKEKSLKFYFVQGNHDINEKGESSIEFLKAYGKVITKCCIKEIEGKKILFLPYVKDKSIWRDVIKSSDSDILVGHIEIEGADFGHILHTGQGLLQKEELSKFSFCFIGHYHKFQKLSENIICLGSIYQTDWGDVYKKYFGIFRNNSLSIKEIPLYLDRLTIEVKTINQLKILKDMNLKDSVIRFDISDIIFNDSVEYLNKIQAKLKFYNVIPSVEIVKTTDTNSGMSVLNFKKWCLQALKQIDDKEKREFYLKILNEEILI